jgi:hypothetical protein
MLGFGRVMGVATLGCCGSKRPNEMVVSPKGTATGLVLAIGLRDEGATG